MPDRPIRTYRTPLDTFREDELGILVWVNHEHATRPQTRLLATLTSHYSSNPMAFPIADLIKSIPKAVLADADTLTARLLVSTEEEPIIISLPLATSHFGWTDFYVTDR